MRRRNLLLVIAGLAVVVSTAGAVVLWPQSVRITATNYERIRVGMSRAEVEAILGPPGDYTNGPILILPEPGVVLGEFAFDASVNRKWSGDRAMIKVTFGPTGDVRGATCWTAGRIEQSPLDNLVWRFKHQWRRWFR